MGLKETGKSKGQIGYGFGSGHIPSSEGSSPPTRGARVGFGPVRRGAAGPAGAGKTEGSPQGLCLAEGE